MAKRQAKVGFNKVWFAIAIKNVRDKFHYNFQVGYKVHHTRYKGVNVGFTTLLHIEIKAMTKARMHAKGQVTKLQQVNIE
jgi:hypothetical protein